MNLPVNTIIHGKCLDVLKTLPDSSIDSIVTDVPYGLGNRDPTAAEIIAYLQGTDLSMSEFMGKDWDFPSVAVWLECFRVLKPGGFLLTFAGTRTLDLVSIGIRVAGFENRDCIDVEMGPPVLRWIRAQGMPKSTDISKVIDKKAGADREVIGENPNRRNAHKKGGAGFDKALGGEDLDSMLVTLSSTDQAKQWSGWGTALKPYWEPILMFRKPVEEKTVVDQVLKTGTGGINIDGCRVRHSSPEDFAKHKAGVDAIKARGGIMANSWKNSSDLSAANEVSLEGRFPPNVIFVHSDLCRKVGAELAAMPPINRFDDGAKPFGGGAGHEYTTVDRGDELVTVWDCHISCPVRWLNDQSGKTISRPDLRSEGHMDTRTGGECWRFKRSPSFYSDSGGASRYFYGVDPGSLFFYVPKPSASEKNDGVENVHPTVKPVRLMEYLVRLVTRKGGVVLDPYCGSGTTCVAAVTEGMDFIGVEKELPSVKTAQARTTKALQERLELQSQQEAFDLSMTLESD